MAQSVKFLNTSFNTENLPKTPNCSEYLKTMTEERIQIPCLGEKRIKDGKSTTTDKGQNDSNIILKKYSIDIRPRIKEKKISRSNEVQKRKRYNKTFIGHRDPEQHIKKHDLKTEPNQTKVKSITWSNYITDNFFRQETNLSHEETSPGRNKQTPKHRKITGKNR